MTTLLFFHGGPGMNANPERHILTSPYLEKGIELRFWEEPSMSRPQGFAYRHENAFQNLLDSAVSFFLDQYDGVPLPVFAFCYGCIPVFHLLKLFPEKISKVILAAPDFCLKEANENMFRLSMENYRKHGIEDVANELDQIISAHDGSFNENTIQGFRYYASSPGLFDFYWTDKVWQERFVAYFSGSEYSLDVDAFFAVRGSMFPLRLEGCPVPAMLIYGEKDRIISMEAEINNLHGQFSDIKTIPINCDHYIHIEELDNCLELISEFIQAR